jgi:hypothetical protein
MDVSSNVAPTEPSIAEKALLKSSELDKNAVQDTEGEFSKTGKATCSTELSANVYFP